MQLAHTAAAWNGPAWAAPATPQVLRFYKLRARELQRLVETEARLSTEVRGGLLRDGTQGVLREARLAAAEHFPRLVGMRS